MIYIVIKKRLLFLLTLLILIYADSSFALLFVLLVANLVVSYSLPGLLKGNWQFYQLMSYMSGLPITLIKFLPTCPNPNEIPKYVGINLKCSFEYND
jgi:hypothetical protein